MSDRAAAVGFRVLGARARLLGTGDSDSLQNVNTTALPDGSLCWVSDIAALYVLLRDATTPPSGTAVVAPASGPGRWIPIADGLTGDSIFTNAALYPSIQVAALAAIASGKPLWIPEGTYNMTPWVIASPLVVIGAGMGLTILKLVDADLNTDPLIQINSSNVSLRGFSIDGNQAAYAPIPGASTARLLTKAGIVVSDLVAPNSGTTATFSDITIEDVEIRETFGNAVYAFNTSRFYVRNCYLHDMFHGIFNVNMNAMGTVSDMQVTGCTFRNISHGTEPAAPDAILPHQIDGVIIEGNTLDTVSRCFCKFEFCKRVCCSDNTMVHNLSDNFPGIQAVGTPELTISDNTIDDFGAGILVDGVEIDTVTLAGTVNVCGNTISNTRGPTIGDGVIVTSGGIDYAVTDNVITNTQRTGIHVDGHFTGLTVSDNTVSTSGAAGTIGIDVGPSSSGLGNMEGLIVSNNNVKALGAGSQGIFLGLVGGPATITNLVVSDNRIQVNDLRPGIGGQFCVGALVDGNQSNGNFQMQATVGNSGIEFGVNNFGSVVLCDGALRVITADAQTVEPTNRTVGINIAGVTRNVTLPATDITQDGKIFTIKDLRGDAGGTPITILPPATSSIQGGPNVQITTNFGSVRLFSRFDTNTWYLA